MNWYADLDGESLLGGLVNVTYQEPALDFNVLFKASPEETCHFFYTKLKNQRVYRCFVTICSYVGGRCQGIKSWLIILLVI